MAGKHHMHVYPDDPEYFRHLDDKKPKCPCCEERWPPPGWKICGHCYEWWCQPNEHGEYGPETCNGKVR